MPKSLASLAATLCFMGALGPATARGRVDLTPNLHSVAVISLLGDFLQALSGKRVATPDAGFDAMCEKTISDQISADAPHAVVTTVDLPRDKLLDDIYPKAGFGDIGMERIRGDLELWAATHSIDFIVILRKVVGVADPEAFIKFVSFGIGLVPFETSAAPNSDETAAFLNITVLDGKTLEVVNDLSVRDVGWGSIHYARNDPTPEHLPTLVSDSKDMLQSIVPALTREVGF